jgi:hypothetical protein
MHAKEAKHRCRSKKTVLVCKSHKGFSRPAALLVCSRNLRLAKRLEANQMTVEEYEAGPPTDQGKLLNSLTGQVLRLNTAVHALLAQSGGGPLLLFAEKPKLGPALRARDYKAEIVTIHYDSKGKYSGVTLKAKEDMPGGISSGDVFDLDSQDWQEPVKTGASGTKLLSLRFNPDDEVDGIDVLVLV